MKTIAKSKIYMLVTIIAVLVLSVGLSFCAWDTKSLESQIDGGSALFGNDNYILGYDANSNNIADVGDTVWFGNYFQQANETTKTPLEWRVVDIRPENRNNVMYLLSEKVLALGSFWGATECYDENGNFIYPKVYNQCYNESNVRAWLNSLARTDGGIDFNGNNTNRKVFNGFYNEAFTATQKNLIIGRTISGMRGSVKTNNAIIEYATLANEKVWVPSMMEIFGVDYMDRTGVNLPTQYYGDNLNDIQFEYYRGVSNTVLANEAILKTSPTSYSISEYGNYTSLSKHQNSSAIENNIAWVTRSSTINILPDTTNGGGAIVGQILTRMSSNYCNGCLFGIKPSICLER